MEFIELVENYTNDEEMKINLVVTFFCLRNKYKKLSLKNKFQKVLKIVNK